MDLTRRVSGTEVTLGVKAFDEASGTRVATGELVAAHVWHCSLSLPPVTAGGTANEPIEAIGGARSRVSSWPRWGSPSLRARPGAGGWESTTGRASTGDHIHVAVVLVREDGTNASTHNDYIRASRVVAELEQCYGLQVVVGA